MIYIGIDTGTNTGLAVWDSTRHQLKQLTTLPIHRAMETVLMWRDVVGKDNISVVFEDARLRKWYSGDTNAKAQGAGSIKRDASIWEDFLKDYKIPFRAEPPKKGMTKMSPDYFRKVTAWEGRTSNHARDAALLVLGR